MPRARDAQTIIALATLIVGVAHLPNLFGYAATPEVFTGIYFNPDDGYSYLAKMRQGWRGEWLFTLPYTQNPGPGAFIFVYYIALGHLARWFSLSVPLVYQGARFINGVLFLFAAHHLISRFIVDPASRRRVWLAFSVSSGFGWFAMTAWGYKTGDLWIAEAIPFLTLFSNAHFPLAWALLLLLLGDTLPSLAPPASARHLTRIFVLTTVLAQVQPMVLLNLGLILGGLTLGRWILQRRWTADEWKIGVTTAVAALPWLLHAQWVTGTTTTLASWSAQNLTPSPPLGDTLLSGGLLLVLALPGLATALRRRTENDLVLAGWFLLNAAALYAPFALQRRLSLGVWMPMTLLAWSGWRETIAPRVSEPMRRISMPLGVATLVLSNALLLAATVGAVYVRDPHLFMSRGEAAAIDWLREHGRGKVVLAAPGLALFIPALSDARVLYGHPFETVGAAERRQAVESFFEGKGDPAAFVASERIDLIIYGPREAALGSMPQLPGWRRVADWNGVTVFGPEGAHASSGS